MAKVAKSITLFEKKKSKISELEFKMIILQKLLRRMQEGGGGLHFTHCPCSMILIIDLNLLL
jgi:hypothetical protein